ncbi:hypothetical protein AB1046_04080 [Promicromonospora sp. Populi]|uniref:PH-like domain-containing protein n=1 Tax=Promicromonospora sp. Populi TaxID=3239420 RepID=UPI0034E28BCE
MTVLAVTLLVALAIFLVLYVTLIGRRRLAQRTTTLVPVPPRAPRGIGPVRFGPVEAVYVSTTLHGDWLARVGAHGLGDRSSALVSVHDSDPGQYSDPGHDGSGREGGVLVERDGADELWLPVDTIRSAGLAPGMAGKYVGADGLVVVTWAVPEADDVDAALVDTGLRTRRPQDREALVDAVRNLLAQQAPQPQQAYEQEQTQQHPQHPQHPEQDPYQQEAR